MQQVGGSVGTALLSTIAASATLAYSKTHHGTTAAVNAAVHGYSVAFMISGSVFFFGAILLFSLIEPRRAAAPTAEPAAVLEPALH
jgi:hypothetical protein